MNLKKAQLATFNACISGAPDPVVITIKDLHIRSLTAENQTTTGAICRAVPQSPRRRVIADKVAIVLEAQPASVAVARVGVGSPEDGVVTAVDDKVDVGLELVLDSVGEGEEGLLAGWDVEPTEAERAGVS